MQQNVDDVWKERDAIQDEEWYKARASVLLGVSLEKPEPEPHNPWPVRVPFLAWGAVVCLTIAAVFHSLTF